MPTELPSEGHLGHLGITADIHLDLADNLGVQFGAGLHSQGPVATDNGSTPKHLTITLHPRCGGHSRFSECLVCRVQAGSWNMELSWPR